MTVSNNHTNTKRDIIIELLKKLKPNEIAVFGDRATKKWAEYLAAKYNLDLDESRIIEIYPGFRALMADKNFCDKEKKLVFDPQWVKLYLNNAKDEARRLLNY